MYPEAVSYFTLLADDIERAKSLDPTLKYTNPELRDESVEYIGISFLDYGGAEGAAAYLNDIGGRSYGVKVLKRIGDAYMEEKEEYEKAIEAYEILLKMFPNANEAPEIQSNIVSCYQYLEDDRMVYISRDELFKTYNPGSEWWTSNSDDKSKGNAQALSEKAIRENINLLFQRAQETNGSELFLQVVSDSRKYLKAFPDDSNAALIHWNLAWTLDTKLNQRNQAFDEYMKISDLYWDSKYQKFAAENAIVLAKEGTAKADSLAQKEPLAEGTIGEITSDLQSGSTFRDALVHKGQGNERSRPKIGRGLQ